MYFPKLKNTIEVQKDKIQLYCNQVFVTDSVEGIVPEFLTLLHGVLDSPDIPLNVSRSYLQSDSNVKKISSHITKKVGDRLKEIFKENREDFEKKWDNLKIFIEYGIPDPVAWGTRFTGYPIERIPLVPVTDSVEGIVPLFPSPFDLFLLFCHLYSAHIARAPLHERS